MVKLMLPFVLLHVGFMLEANAIVAFAMASPVIVQPLVVVSVLRSATALKAYLRPLAPKLQLFGVKGFVAQPFSVAE